MNYKYRLVHLANGKCRIQKKHWLFTLGFWSTMSDVWGDTFEASEQRCRKELERVIQEDKGIKIERYEEL